MIHVGKSGPDVMELHGRVIGEAVIGGIGYCYTKQRRR